MTTTSRARPVELADDIYHLGARTHQYDHGTAGPLRYIRNRASVAGASQVVAAHLEAGPLQVGGHGRPHRAQANYTDHIAHAG